jgi:NAD(P)-dependent dehydrogenase (short-subunit alcohol dehydrogenase family)
MVSQKVAVITGGTRGIGLGIARKMAEENCALAIMSRSSKEKVRNNLNEIKSFGIPLLYYSGSLADSNCRRTFCDKIMTEESYNYVIGINLNGTFFLTQQIANIMIREVKENPKIKPKIINISSINSCSVSVNRGEYCISKAGISMITQLFAVRLAQWGINVYEIRPGIIQTDMTSVVKDKYDRLIKEGVNPICRWGYPEDIGKAVSMICSGYLDFSTGEVINVDGGFHLRRL